MNVKEGFLWKKKREIIRVHDLLKDVDTFDQPLQVEVNRMKSGMQAQEPYYMECAKGKVDALPWDHEFPDGKGGTHVVPTTTIFTETTKPGMVIVLGKLPELVYHANKNNMEIYKKYKDIAAAALLFVWQLVNIHLMLQPVGDVVIRFWEDPWIMFMIGAMTMLLLSIKALSDDFSLAVLKVTAQIQKTDNVNRIAYMTVCSSMPLARQFELLGVRTPEEATARMEALFGRILEVTVSQWESARRYIRKLEEETALQSNKERRSVIMAPGEEKLALRKTEWLQTVSVLSVCGAIFLGFLLIVFHYAG